MNRELIEFQAQIKTFLLNAKKKNRLSHAYIFQGQTGVGKSEMAQFFAQMLYCNEEEPCSSCSSCAQIEKNEHLNVVIVRPETKVIKKEQIISLHEEFSKTSQVSGPRIYIIIDADKMNQNSQNSLLKFIEEPTDGIYGILCTTNISQLLPTITSRCQILNFKSLDESKLQDSLVKNGLLKEQATIISFITNNLSEAMDFSKQEDIIKLQEVFEGFMKLKNSKDATVFQIANISFFDNNENLRKFLNLLISLYSDIISIFSGSTLLKFKCYLDLITKYMNRLSKNDAINHLELIYELSKKMQYNVSCKNIITNLFVNLF